MWLALLFLTACREAPGAPDSGARPPDVLMISLDTLRRDALGHYGASSDATPFLDCLLYTSDAADE